VYSKARSNSDGSYECAGEEYAVPRVPTPPAKSWKVLDFFLENSRTWKVLEIEA